MGYGVKTMFETYGKTLEGGLMPQGMAGVLAERMETNMAIRDRGQRTPYGAISARRPGGAGRGLRISRFGIFRR